jgi:hypothetical protein
MAFSLTAPLLFNVQRFDNVKEEFAEISSIFDSLRNVEKEIRKNVVISCLDYFYVCIFNL